MDAPGRRWLRTIAESPGSGAAPMLHLMSDFLVGHLDVPGPVKRTAWSLILALSLFPIACRPGPPAELSPTMEPAPQVESILRRYYQSGGYGPRPGAVAVGGCRADDGQVCFGGDQEDQLCARLPGCRTDEEVSTFLDDLRGAAIARPADPSAVGQAVYAFARFNRLLEAKALVDRCEAGDGWCGLLDGIVFYRAVQPERAEAAFRVALDTVSPELACHLLDVAPLLGDPDRRQYESRPCSDRARAHEWFWWLADPLWSKPGNDRWVAHVARGVEAVLHAQILHAVRAAHPDAHERALIRRGFEDSFDDRGRFVSQRAACCHFVPETPVLGASFDSLDYRLEAGRQDEGHTPPYGSVRHLAGQVTRFLDGDSLVVAIVTHDDVVEPEMIIGQGPAMEREITAARRVGRGWVTTTRVPEAIWVASLEAAGRDSLYFRRRARIAPLDPGTVRASDLLLLRADDGALPDDRGAALATAMGTDELQAGEPVGFYWEVYGVPSGQSLTFTLGVDGADPGLLQRLAQRLGLTDDGRRGSIIWSEVAEGSVHTRAIELDTRALEPGTYQIRVTIETDEGHIARAYRTLHVVDAG